MSLLWLLCNLSKRKDAMEQNIHKYLDFCCEAGRYMIKNGADVVLRQHSHCIGCYENYNDGHILYGQGNFHFIWEHKFEGWHTSLAVKYDTKSNEIEFTPLKNNTNGIGIPDKDEYNKIINAFNDSLALSKSPLLLI